MSRSRKKHGVVKDRGLTRREWNRKFRRVNRQRVRMGKDPYQMKELINPYDVYDWIYIWDESDMQRRWAEDGRHDYYKRVYKTLDNMRRWYFRK
jgi:hypothetical protein